MRPSAAKLKAERGTYDCSPQQLKEILRSGGKPEAGVNGTGEGEGVLRSRREVTAPRRKKLPRLRLFLRAAGGARLARPEGFRNRWAESLLLLVLVSAFAWKAFIPAWRSLNSDFPNYYLAARLYRQGYPIERVYDWVWFQRQKDHAGVERPHVSFDPNPPTCVLPVLPFSAR